MSFLKISEQLLDRMVAHEAALRSKLIPVEGPNPGDVLSPNGPRLRRGKPYEEPPLATKIGRQRRLVEALREKKLVTPPA